MKYSYIFLSLNPSYGGRWLSSSSSQSTRPEFTGENAYDILGVSETSSLAEIKASFHKLAKQTHPDLSHHSNAFNSHRFIQILAAYEILSDAEKRAHYDSYLLSQRKRVLTQGSTLYRYESRMTMNKEMEVVEWLKWYRLAINDILSQREVVAGTGYFDVLETDFYSAIHAAYYGPVIESMNLLPDRFEAEERSVHETPEVLHLVSGRHLFGMVCLADKIPKLSSASTKKLKNAFASFGLGVCKSVEDTCVLKNSNAVDDAGISQMHPGNSVSDKSDAYEDLELHVSGRVVAVATRVPPKNQDGRAVQNEDAQDQIHVFLKSDDDLVHASKGFYKESLVPGAVGARIPLGTIKGMGSSLEEGSCFVYDACGTKTHVIMKHRTLMVKHMHWYGVGDKVSIVECRCSRARLPPSKRLHPAMYLLALAYRTLDIEDTKRRKRTVRNLVESQLFRILHWCKKLV
ncbi:PREDICTED: uncharacterized protein LOC105112703 isoform X2 [Populus euphratica]|uniref:Uncharacterized protein LOC105112703 isoform X2 n=1 Tax=Populus euphratica TaxID=75702 RepID=A0AAJ6T8R3_POPEU|nr:PREDICTED: uncharacterized protein LOC105112703 isoform X2 [Populus euphratica]